MNWEQIKGGWKRITRMFKREDSDELTDEELAIIAEKRDQLVNVLRETCHCEKEEVEKELDRFTGRIDATRKQNRSVAAAGSASCAVRNVAGKQHRQFGRLLSNATQSWPHLEAWLFMARNLGERKFR